MRIQNLYRARAKRFSTTAQGTQPNVADQGKAEGGRFFVRRYASAATTPRSQEFGAETVFWDPLLISDSNGRATIRFGIPAAGVYRLRVNGHLNGRLGSAEWKVSAQ